MEDLIYYNNLYDLYKNLLTDKQRQYFEDYYFKNLSLSEISENYNISRNAISKQLGVIRKKLYEYEQQLSLFQKQNSILSLPIDDSLKDKIIDILLS